MTSLNVTFSSDQSTLDASKTVTAHVLWLKCDHAIKHAFPTLTQTVYYKQLMLYGAQRYWETTWMERFHTARRLEDSVTENNLCWAALIKFYLDKLWPSLQGISDHQMEQLESIHQITNRIRGSRFQGIAVANQCISPTAIEGFIDIYPNITANEWISNWAKTVFCPKK